MPVVGQRDDGAAGLGHDQARVFAFRRLAVEVGHRSGVARLEPTIERAGVRILSEHGDADRVESQRAGSAFQLDAHILHTSLSRRLYSTSSFLTSPLDAFLLDAVRLQSRIVSLRHRANLTTSSTVGMASSSP